MPRHCAFQTVSVKGYVDRVEFVFNGAVVATHSRSYQKGEQVLEPLHYLVALKRRPAALDHSNVYRNWRLAAVFDELRQRLENRHGLRAGAKQYVRVLQLLAQHPMQRVKQSIEQLRGPEGADADLIIRRVERSAAAVHYSVESSGAILSEEEVSRPEVLSVEVPCPSLNHFDQFLPSSCEGDNDHERPKENPSEEIPKRSESTAVEKQPEAVKITNDKCGVRETGSRGNQLESNIRAIPAPTERIGSGGSQYKRVSEPDQTGSVPDGKGFGGLRFLSAQIDQQTESIGTVPLRMGTAMFQCLLAWSAGNWKNAFCDWLEVVVSFYMRLSQ